MADDAPPRIEFPCAYPIKVMGPNAEDFADMVLEIGRRHAPEVSRTDLALRASRNGRWLAVTLTIEARSAAQIEALFADLKATGRVTLVL